MAVTNREELDTAKKGLGLSTQAANSRTHVVQVAADLGETAYISCKMERGTSIELLLLGVRNRIHIPLEKSLLHSLGIAPTAHLEEHYLGLGNLVCHQGPTSLKTGRTLWNTFIVFLRNSFGS